MSRPTRSLGVLGVAAVVALALVGSTTAAKAASSRSKTPLVGTNWVLTGRTSLGVPLVNAAASARFARDGRLTGQVACNLYNTSFEVDGPKLSIGPEVSSTLVNCSSAENAVARAYLARLPRVRSYSISGTTLTLSGTRDRRLLTYRASGAQDLVAKWSATSYYTVTAVQSVAVGSTVTADFSKTEVSGDGGCRRFSGPYTTSGQNIEIGPLASTLRACSDAALTTQEQQYLAALELATTFRVTGDKLELLREGGTIAATFKKAN